MKIYISRIITVFLLLGLAVFLLFNFVLPSEPPRKTHRLTIRGSDGSELSIELGENMSPEAMIQLRGMADNAMTLKAVDLQRQVGRQKRRDNLTAFRYSLYFLSFLAVLAVVVMVLRNNKDVAA